tara:strand:- start:4045 stop:12129 length:8085 start_codon:yes stop_codon:yes gene_type:complete
MAIPVSSSLLQLNAETFLQEGFELSLDAIIPSIILTGSFSTTTSKTQFYIYNYAKTVLYENLNYQANGSYLTPENVNSPTNSSSSYNQFELTPVEDVYNQGYSSGKYYTIYNFINYELGSELIEDNESYEGHPYFLKDISGDRTEIRIANNFLTSQQIETYYNQFTEKLNALENADEFYISFGNNRNFIGVNSLLETSTIEGNSILIKLYKPLPSDFQLEEQLQIITKVGETQAYEVEFSPNLEFIDNLLSLKGPNYNVAIKDRVNNSTNFKSLNDLINTNSSQSYYQFSQLQNQKGIILRKNWGDWSQFVKYSSAEQRLNNFFDKLASIESSSAELTSLETITNSTTASVDYSSSYNAISNNINQVISKFDSYEYFLYYVTGSESWPKRTNTYPYDNYSVTSSAGLNWFGSTNETSAYFNSGKNQIYSASRYDNDNQDYLYYLIPPFITENNSNDQYIKFVNMTGQAFDEMFIYTEAVEQVRNTNSPLTGSVLPLGLADEVIESLGFETYANDFNSIGFNVNGVGVFPATGSGLEYIDRYIDIASGSVINYYDQQQSTLGFVIALADPSFPYPIENSAQEIYKRIFHNMISLVKRKGTVTGLRQLINIWGVPNTMLRISEFGGKNKDDENDYDLWMNRYSTAFNSFPTPITASIPQTFYPANANAMFPWTPLAGNYLETATTPDVAVPDCIQFRFKTARDVSGTTNFSESVLLKRGQNGFGGSSKELNNGDFGIYLHQSGSNSGSYSGASDPHYNTYASMSFVISGSIDEGASYYRDIAGTFYANCYVTDPIYLPFYNKGWWTVQIQRMTHLSASNEDNTLNEYELKVGQNIYDGYDGNQIGWLASSSLRMIDNKVSQSMNAAWNRFYMDDGPGDLYDIHNYLDSQVYLPGNIVHHSVYRAPNCVGKANTYTIPGFNLGDTMSGSFQEFRYYRRALSASSFLDLVMNPESIQGHSDSNYGPGSSYDLLSYRVPLGNELEFNNPNGAAAYMDASGWVNNIRQFAFGQLIPTSEHAGTSGGESVGSVHPSAINYDNSRSLFTGSFFQSNMSFGINASQAIQPYFLNFRFNSNPNLNITSSYIVPNTEINYMDQPSAGIRNRIKNKIQVIDGNEYGTTLSPFRSIQQEFEQSASYTEDLNSLEVGFSFQNEINDDIISTFGHGVVSDVIADPRLISESGDRYPELTRIAEEYFNKYQGFTVNSPLYNPGNVTAPPHIIEREFDYNRLIKFYETSLFKAIKNYIPARTSLSTGIIVKQHLLERNRTDIATGINIDTVIAKTPETGSENGLNNAPQSNNSRIFTPGESGFNSPIQQENLLITSSIRVATITGSTGGSLDRYNYDSTASFGQYIITQSWNNYIDTPLGLYIEVEDTEKEFYNGEFSGSNVSMIPPRYNPYRIYADGNDKNPDTSFLFLPPTLNLAAGAYNATKFPVVSANAATATPVRSTASLVHPSGSANGAAPSSDAIYIGTTTNSPGDPVGTSGYLELEDYLGNCRQLFVIDSPQNGYDAAANGKWIIGADNNWVFGDITSSGVHNLCNVGTSAPPWGSGTATLTLTGGTSGKVITAYVNVTAMSSYYFNWIKITDWNPNNDNDTKWVDPTETFSGFAHSVTWTITFNATTYNTHDQSPNLFMIQLNNPGSPASTKAWNLSDAIMSTDSFNGAISASVDLTTFGGVYPNVQLFQTGVGVAGNTAITIGQIGAYDAFAPNGFAFIGFGAGAGNYYFPTIFQGGVDAVANDPNVYLQNSITGLTPGVTYNISFTVAQYSYDGFGGAAAVGMSTLDAPSSLGGVTNGVPATIRVTGNGTVTGQWTQGAGTTTAMFFASPGVSANISNVNIITPGSLLAPKHLFERSSWTIMPTQSQIFQMSPYNPLLHNVSGSRANSFLYDMDFDPITSGSTLIVGRPNDYSLTVSASQLGWEGSPSTADALLEYAQVPDSNYTTKAIINPRYEGSLLQSADYNFYTGIPSESLAVGRSATSGIIGLANPPYLLTQHKVRYINSETGSWRGDISYGRTAVIDKHPIFMGHFKQSFSEPSVFNTTTFVLDQLIQIPFEEILTEQSPIITSSLINGSNENLIPVSSTFEVNRKASIYYKSNTKTFAEFGLTLNYSNVGIGSHLIFAPATNFISKWSNQITPNQLTTIYSYSRPQWNFSPNGDWYNAGTSTVSKAGGLAITNFLPTVKFEEVSQLQLLEMVSSSAVHIFTTGSSDYARSKGLGILNLLGPFSNTYGTNGMNIDITSVSTDGYITRLGTVGPTLALHNSININTRRGDAAVSSSIAGKDYGVPGVNYPRLQSTYMASEAFNYQSGSNFGSIPVVPQTKGCGMAGGFGPTGFTQPGGDPILPVILDTDDNKNYWRLNFSESMVNDYEKYEKGFEIEVGDEIRVSYRFPKEGLETSGNKPPVNFEIITQDFKVIEYEIAPPAVATSPFAFPVAGFTQNMVIPGLITSSGPEFKGYATQIDEYYRRLSIASQNKSCFYLSNSTASLEKDIGSGSFVHSCSLLNYVTNVDGESRPTEVGVAIRLSGAYLKEPTNGGAGVSIPYIFGTNMSGVDDIERSRFGTGSLVSPRQWGGGLGFNYQRKLYLTDNEDTTLNIAFDAGFVWNRLIVDPDPVTLSKPIPSGSILAATIRRRTELDERVVLNLPPPSGSHGINTVSGDGYIIPNDLTEIQQRNVQKIINKLQSENVFTNTDNNTTQD